jgi:hypothetical protein
MIKMSHSKLAALQARLAPLMAVAALSGALGGCCGGAHSHKCDFTPLDSQHDAGSDAPLACGTQVCMPPQVCCLTKVAPFAQCINIEDFAQDRCESVQGNMPDCTGPSDCDAGMVCCLQTVALTVSCQVPPLCPGDGVSSYLICVTDHDCPAQKPGSCNGIPGVPDGGPLICNPN